MSRHQPVRVELDVESVDYHPSRAGMVANFVIDNVLGFRSPQAKANVAEVPDGVAVCHTGRGQVYLSALSSDIQRADAARNEHIRPGATTSWKSSFGTLAEVFGEGIFQYFDFIIFLLITNAILLIPGVISMIPHFVFDKWNSETIQGNFYIGTLSPKSFRYWWWPTAVACGVILLTFGPAIAFRISRRFKKKHIVDTEDEYALDRADVVKDKTGLAVNPARKQVWRFVLSYILFLLLLGVSGIITLGFVAAQYYVPQFQAPEAVPVIAPIIAPVSIPTAPVIAPIEPVSPLPITIPQAYPVAPVTVPDVSKFAGSILVSVILTIFNLIWTLVCAGLTWIEAHYTWTSFKTHHTFKLFIWKILNVCLMFLGFWLAARCYLSEVPIWGWIADLGSTSTPSTSPSSSPTSTPSTDKECVPRCGIDNLGDQFITLLLADLFLSNFVRIAYPYFGWKLWGCCTGKKTSRESDAGRIEFDIAISYLDLLYRQFIIYLGTPFVPFLPVLGMVLNGIQIAIDKWRLLKLCKTPPFLSGSMKHFLIFFLFFSALVSIAVFPYGTAWVLSRYTLRPTCGHVTWMNTPIT